MSQAWFVLYRPSAPSVRAQAVQVLATAGALATRGHRVTVCVQTEASDAAIREAHALPSSLHLVRLPLGNTWASLAYRASFADFIRRTKGRRWVLARSKRHAHWALRWFGGRFRLIMEAHEVDSLRTDRAIEGVHALERQVLRSAVGLVANAVGTLADLRATHWPLPPATVIANAALPGGPAMSPGADIGWLGSIRPDKDPETVAHAARTLSHRIVVGGPTAADVAPLVERSQGRLIVEPARWPAQVPERLRQFRVLLVPLSRGRFGERWSSPLKLYDALASGVPIVAADTAAVRAIAGSAFVPYRPGDAKSLQEALDRAMTDEPLRRQLRDAARPRRRTWDLRAQELEAFAHRIAR
ncbi:MAG: glycosyltransferase family 4 protein [Myxococcota bacterium]